MRRLGLSLALAAALLAGCATYNRGRFAMASATLVPLRVKTIEPNAVGRACGEVLVQRLERAVEDALRKSPGANALVDASFHFERLCTVVRGAAVRVED